MFYELIYFYIYKIKENLFDITEKFLWSWLFILSVNERLVLMPTAISSLLQTNHMCVYHKGKKLFCFSGWPSVYFSGGGCYLTLKALNNNIKLKYKGKTLSLSKQVILITLKKKLRNYYYYFNFQVFFQISFSCLITPFPKAKFIFPKLCCQISRNVKGSFAFLPPCYTRIFSRKHILPFLNLLKITLFSFFTSSKGKKNLFARHFELTNSPTNSHFAAWDAPMDLCSKKETGFDMLWWSSRIHSKGKLKMHSFLGKSRIEQNAE